MEFKNKIVGGLLGFKRERDPGDEETLGDMYKLILKIAWPAALEGLLMTLMNSFDTMMVGKLGSAAITSVGLCAQPRMILLLIAQSLSMGTTAVVARRKGEGHRDAAVSTLMQSLVINVGLGILMSIMGLTLGIPLLKLSGANSETLDGAWTYFRILSFTFIGNCLTLCVCAAMRGVGKTKITMIVHMISNVVNIFFNYCLILGHFGFPALGITGAAIATDIGTVVGMLVALAVLFIKKDNYLCILPFRKFSFDKDTISSLVTVGSGSIAESVFMRIGFLINGKLIAGISTAAYATYQIVSQVTTLTFSLGDGVAAACTSMVGQSMGAGMKKKAFYYAKVGQRICVYMSLALMLFIFGCRNWLPTLFSEETDIIYASAIAFIVCLPGIYPQNQRVMVSGCLRGAGDVKFVAFVSLVSVAILRPVSTWFFSYPMAKWFPALMLGYVGPWISFDLDSFCRSILLQIRLDKGEWVNIKL